MSGYKGPRGPNVSQYIANLNQLSPVTEALAEPQPTSDDFSAFLNTDFFDINGGTNVDLTAPIDFGVDFDIKSSAQPTAENSPRPSFSAPSTKPGMDFNLNADFQFTDFSNFNAAPILDTSMPALSQTYPLPAYAPPPSAISPLGGYDDASRKRKASDDLDISIGTPNLNLDESARGAAEEDKRRRNTAASARFRVKKKQREQALEKQTKEMSDKMQQLESKVQQLEMENKWLKGLITEKADSVTKSSEAPSAPAVATEKKQETDAEERSLHSRTVGVGTEAEAGEA